MNERVDATTAATAPFQPEAPHQALASMVGRWSGPTQTWLAPDAAPDESRTEATVEALLGGRWIRIDYQGTVQGEPHAGQMLVGFHKDAKVFEIALVDSFHTATSIILSTGEARPDGAVSVLGSFGAGEERWGWRTVIRQPQPGELVIEAYVISPAGREARAIETRLTRC